MKVIITGATGMIGGLVLNHCIVSDKITQVVCIGRKKVMNDHPKITQVIRDDFLNYDDITDHFKKVDGVYYCQGVYTGAVPKEIFRTITIDYVEAFGSKLKLESPDSFFSFLSGAGADQTEKSRALFAKYKGRVEKYLMKHFKDIFIFRPGYIYPVTPRKEPSIMYRIIRSLYPVIKMFGDKASIKSTELAKAMYLSGLSSPQKPILENNEILNYLRSNS